MKLLKIISFIFFIYFLRRLWQLYQVMKQSAAAQEAIKETLRKQASQEHKGPPGNDDNIIEVDFKKLD